MLKDMRLASGINGCEKFPVLDAERSQLTAAAQAGWSDEDYSAIMKLL